MWIGCSSIRLSNSPSAVGAPYTVSTCLADDTIRIFTRHGMESIGYWIPQDDRQKTTLIYILAHPSLEAAKKNWLDFRNDPEWKKVAADSEINGKIVEKVVSVFMDPADFSKLK